MSYTLSYTVQEVNLSGIPGFVTPPTLASCLAALAGFGLVSASRVHCVRHSVEIRREGCYSCWVKRFSVDGVPHARKYRLD